MQHCCNLALAEAPQVNPLWRFATGTVGRALALEQTWCQVGFGRGSAALVVRLRPAFSQGM